MKYLFVIVMAVAASICPLLAAPEINSFALRNGSNLPRYNGEIVRAIYSVTNPDAEEADLTLQVIPDGASGGAFFYRHITLPPRASLHGFFPVVFSNTVNYIYRLVQHTKGGDVEVMHGDIPVSLARSGAPSASLQKNSSSAPEEQESSSLEADDFLFVAVSRGGAKATTNGFPNLHRDREINNATRFISFSANSDFCPPSNLAEYAQQGAMLLLEDDYDKYTILQFNALRDFVRNGGLLIVAGSVSTEALNASPLRSLLPIVPVGVRRLENGNELREAWDLPTREYQERDANGDLQEVFGYDFVEAIALPDATVLRNFGALPMAVLRPYGLGNVLWLAFNPVDFTANELEVRPSLWNFILRHANHVPISRRPDSQLLLEGVQQQLLGYSIPPFRTLAIYLAIYVLVSVLLLAGSWKLRHPVIGWGLVCLFGIGLTFCIVCHAHNLSANQPQRQLNCITLQSWDGAPGPKATYATIASREDTALDLQLDNATGFLFPSPAKTSLASTETALERSRLLVSTSGQNTSLVRLNLQENRPRGANWFLASRELETPSADDAPVLSIAPSGDLRISEWTVPDALQPFQRALLLLPSAIHTLNHTDKQLTSIAKEALESDTVLVQVREYLAAKQLRTPAVCLVSIQRRAEPEAEVQISCEAGSFSTYDYILTLVPVQLEWPKSETFTIPPELTWMTIDSSSQLARFWSFGKCTGLSLATVFSETDARQARHSRQPVTLAFPPTAPVGDLVGAEIFYSLLENASGIDIETRLFDATGEKNVKPVSNTAQSSRFGAEAAMAYEPALSRFTVDFIPVLTNPLAAPMEMGASSREQSWWLNNVRAALTFRRSSAAK